MTPDRFTHRGPEAYGIEANAGIDLQARGRQFVVVPRAHRDSDAPAPAPFPLPPLPAPLVEEKVRLLRLLAASDRRGLWALYLDTLPPHGWHAYLPPQWCGPPRGSREPLLPARSGPRPAAPPRRHAAVGAVR